MCRWGEGGGRGCATARRGARRGANCRQVGTSARVGWHPFWCSPDAGPGMQATSRVGGIELADALGVQPLATVNCQLPTVVPLPPCVHVRPGLARNAMWWQGASQVTQVTHPRKLGSVVRVLLGCRPPFVPSMSLCTAPCLQHAYAHPPSPASSTRLHIHHYLIALESRPNACC